MGVNKVEFGDETLIDLTNDTVDEQSVLEGRSFHAKDGTVKEGKVVVAEVIDNVTSTSTTDALSANQGRELNEKINSISVPDNVVLFEDETIPEEPLPRDADLLAGREPSYYENNIKLKDTLDTVPDVPRDADTLGGHSYEEIITRINEYSTEEKRVGTWIDGKPLYEKTIQSTTGAANTDGYISFATDVEIAFIVSGYVNDNFGNFIPINYSTLNSNPSKGICCHIDEQKRIVHKNYGNSGWVNRPLFVTVRYTKTTD